MACADLLIKHAEAWQAAVSHTFLEDCRDGVVQKTQFETWLVQVGPYVRC
jgi:thiaminase